MVRDLGPSKVVDPADQARIASSEFYGTTVQLQAPTPPRIEMTEQMRVGAETFAANLDGAVNGMFFKGGVVPEGLTAGRPAEGASARLSDR